ncbi:MAG: transporter substrate-binding domain-containing protein [Steroidobacteraceae bacterium]
MTSQSAPRRLPVGVVFSTSGPYETVGRELRDGALLGIALANERASGALLLEPEIIDPGGSLDRYREASESLFRRGIHHIIGCYTSSSRKEIIPIVEKFGGLLWYPSHYEGFESCPHVIYTGASPNQHVVPLVRWALPRFGSSVYCIGSNYIWAWENTRIMRGLIQEAGGRVLRERYIAIGATDVDEIVNEIAEVRPDFVFNTLIGESAYRFYRAYHRLGLRDDRFQAPRPPILSCSLSEPELLAVGPAAAAGHLASSVYFQSVARPENVHFAEAFRARFGDRRVTSADAEAAFIAAQLLASSLRYTDADDIQAVKHAAYACHIKAPQGEVWIDLDNNHAWLTPRIGRANDAGGFDIAWEADGPWRPDPYLTAPTSVMAWEEDASARPKFRLVRN